MFVIVGVLGGLVWLIFIEFWSCVWCGWLCFVLILFDLCLFDLICWILIDYSSCLGVCIYVLVVALLFGCCSFWVRLLVIFVVDLYLTLFEYVVNLG